MYWEGRQEDEEGWIRKPYVEVKNETGLGRYELISVREKLVKLNIIEEQRAGIPARLHYRVNWDLLNKLINSSIKPQKKEKPTKKVYNKPASEIEPTISYQMKDAFLKQRKVYHPNIEEYNWTKKDWNFIKLIKNHLEKRAIDKAKKTEPDTDYKPNNQEILQRWTKFLEILPEFYSKNHFYPSSLYTNFSAIEQAVVAESKENKNGKRTNFAGAIKAATGNVQGDN